MTTTAITLLLVSLLPATGDEPRTRASDELFALAFEDRDAPLVIRAQNAPIGGPVLGPIQEENTTYFQPTYTDPNAAFGYPMQSPMMAPGYGAPAPITNDPWLGGGMPYAQPGMGGPYGGYSYGLNGPQPYRYGWTARYDFTYMPSEGTSSPDVGSLGIFGFDVEKEHVAPLPGAWIFSFAPQYNLRLFDGPRGTPGTAHLPGDVHRFGLGLKLATPETAGTTFEVGFTPAFTTDFEASPDRHAFQFDAHAVMFWRWTPQFMVALGAAYWDRVDDLVLPYAGVVWTPNDYLEFRLLFPKPRVSLFLGTPNGVATWLYVSGEYHVESYQIEMSPPGYRDQVQLADWRIMGGARFETGWLTSFIEAGCVLGREVEFRRSTDFDINDGFIMRAGFRY
ncbi:MAG: hypothetical protein KF774_12320 [Planctomyces sp.]|nr:hypothetical protein [Planctomyces sp.]